MEPVQCLDAKLLARLLRGGAKGLGDQRVMVNELNVFPVPDGDTGDNMFMTLDAAASNSKALEELTLGKAAEAAARHMLLGARGNSGVILSRIGAGVAAGLSGYESADTLVLSAALERGVEEAYGAVSKPVEGTMLTVYRDAVRFANSRVTGETALDAYLDDLIAEMKHSLDRTPELLAVLREAGVVDSGGAGLVCIAEGMTAALRGEETVYAPAVSASAAPAKVDLSAFNEHSVLVFGYCTEFLLQLTYAKCNVDTFDEKALFTQLEKMGDSLVCFRDGNIIKTHIHTMRPGDVLNFVQQYGEFLTLKIENMTLQHHENEMDKKHPAVPRPAKPRKAYGTVVVANGEGIRQSFLDLGADQVIDGGQSMNPSAQDFLRAFEEINADTILVFPNNSNIIMTAEQAASLYQGASICVIRSRTIGEGYAALSMLDTSSGDTDAIREEINDIISSVVTGMVSTATRDTVMDGVTIRKGDHIGFTDDVVYTDAPDAEAAALSLSEKLNAGHFDVLLLLVGADADPAGAEQLALSLQQAYRRTEVITIDGRQPVYDYILILQ